MRPSKNWRKKSEIYRYFGRDCSTADWSDEAATAMFAYESHGTALAGDPWANGFYIGKQRMDLYQTMWREDITAGLLFISELTEDTTFPPCVAAWIADWTSRMEQGWAIDMRVEAWARLIAKRLVEKEQHATTSDS